jgi:hypothetical protein
MQLDAVAVAPTATSHQQAPIITNTYNTPHNTAECRLNFCYHPTTARKCHRHHLTTTYTPPATPAAMTPHNTYFCCLPRPGPTTTHHLPPPASTPTSITADHYCKPPHRHVNHPHVVLPPRLPALHHTTDDPFNNAPLAIHHAPALNPPTHY